MTLYILVSLHTVGAEQFCRDFLSLYLEKSPSYWQRLRLSNKEAQVVLFGSQAKLDSCKLNENQFKKEVIGGANMGSTNTFLVSDSIKAYVESNVSGYSNDNMFYILNDVVDENYWNLPRHASNSYQRVQPYFNKLVFIDLACFSLHETFGCGHGCNQICSKCKATHKNCDPTDVAKHATMIQSGRCLKAGCTKTLPKCQWSALSAHSQEHIPPCQNCKTPRGSCLQACHACRKQVCRSSQCQCVLQANYAENIKRMACPLCLKTFNGRQGLESHFQTCKYKEPWLSRCNCGLFFVDEEHKTRHIEGKKGCKLYSPPPPPPAISKKYDDDSMYLAGTPAAQNTSLPKFAAFGGFGHNLVRDICCAFGAENATLYTLSAPEMSCIKEVSNTVSTIVRSSGLVAQTVGFGSADKGTGVPGYVDVDMLVIINDFLPTKRTEYAATLRKLLQDAGANLKNSADDIQQVELEGVEFDLVLVGSDDKNDKRAAGFAEARHNVRELRAIVQTDNYVKEVIRAVKYWSKRSFPTGGIKSCLIEAIVLAQYTAAKTELTALDSQQQRRLTLFTKFFAYVATTTPSTISTSAAAAPGANSKPSADPVTELMASAPITAEQRAAAVQVTEQLSAMLL